MSTSLSVSPIKAAVGWAFSTTTSFGTDISNAASFSYSKTFTNGTGASAANKMYAATLSIGASGTSSLDLAGVLTDFFGTAITFTKIRVIYVENASTNASTHVTLGGNANGLVNWVSALNDKVIVRSGGCFLLACTDATGYAVTAGTGDIFDIINLDGSNGATINVFFCGE